MSKQYDEDTCERCGRCCYQKLWIEDRIYYTPFPCEYLDIETRLCAVYRKRHQVNPQCLDIEEGIRLGVFPADCPYVRDLPDYVPPVEDVIDPLAVRLIEQGKITTPSQLRQYASRQKTKSRDFGC